MRYMISSEGYMGLLRCIQTHVDICLYDRKIGISRKVGLENSSLYYTQYVYQNVNDYRCKNFHVSCRRMLCHRMSYVTNSFQIRIFLLLQYKSPFYEIGRNQEFKFSLINFILLYLGKGFDENGVLTNYRWTPITDGTTCHVRIQKYLK